MERARSDGESYYRALHALAQVSKSWADLIINDPRLWTFVFCGESQDDVTRAVERSGNLPLTLITRFSKEPIHQWRQGGGPGVEDLLRHAHRWKSLALSYNGAAALWHRLESGVGLLSLEELIGYGLQPCLANMPNLLHLSLEACVVPRIDVQGLKTLKLDKILDARADQLLALLVASPGLVELELFVLTYEESDETHSCINLPALRSMKVESGPTAFATFLLAQVSAPRCDHYSIREAGFDEGEAVDPQALLRAIEPHLVTWSSRWISEGMAAPIATVLRPRDFILLRASGEKRFSVESGISTVHLLDWMSSSLFPALTAKQPAKAKVAVSFSPRQGFDLSETRVASTIMDIKAHVLLDLRAEDPPRGLDSFFDRLSGPYGSGDRNNGMTTYWSIPYLSIIHFTGFRGPWNTLLKMVRFRYRNQPLEAQLKDTGASGCAPVCLLFSDCEMDQANKEDLKAIVGSFRWRGKNASALWE
ncbi:hypothetical protein FRB95_012002 [Tulasnella sp. JGI-2019a]|nr:hypothetical protein FRB95_012002 [Tulasnella sp. JGI-2019a]